MTTTPAAAVGPPAPFTEAAPERPFGMATTFDEPNQPLSIPGAVTSGRQAELKLVDGLTRGDRVVGRFETSPGLFAVKVDQPTGPVRVTVELAADADTAAWWERLVPEHVQPRAPYGPRLLAVRSQGETRGVVLLAKRVTDFGLRAKARVGFRLEAEELPADGFLVVEVVDLPVAGPDWATPVAPHAVVGVRVDAVHVTATAPEPTVPSRPGTTLDGGTCERLGLVSAGSASGDRAAVEVRPDFFVAQPIPGCAGPVTWTLQPHLDGTVRPDPARQAPDGPVIPKPGPDQPPLTTRQKAVVVARHEWAVASTGIRRRARHLAVRGMRKATSPIDHGLSSRAGDGLRARGLLRAVLVPLDTGVEVPCTVDAASRGRVTVTCTEPPTGPAVVYLGAVTADGGPLTRLAGRRLHWQLISARYGRQ